MASSPQDPIVMADLPTAVRLGKLESDVSHIRTDVADLRTDLRITNTRLDACALSVDVRDLGRKIDRQFIWLISFQIGTTGTLLAAIAHGFHWV